MDGNFDRLTPVIHVFYISKENAKRRDDVLYGAGSKKNLVACDSPIDLKMGSFQKSRSTRISYSLIPN